MRTEKERWFATLLNQPKGATRFIREHFPEATFHIEKRETEGKKMIRYIRFDLEGHPVLRARSEVDMEKTHPKIVRLLRETNQPLGEIVSKFKVRRTRLRSTSRTRAFHFLGDLHATVWERFYALPRNKITSD